MPTPNPNESRDDFVGRCIPIVMNEGTAKDQSQAAAICYSMYDQHSKKSLLDYLKEKFFGKKNK